MASITNLFLRGILSTVNFQLHFQQYAFRCILLYFYISFVIFCTVQKAYLWAYSSSKKCDMLLLLKRLLYTFSATSTSGFPFLSRTSLYTVERLSFQWWICYPGCIVVPCMKSLMFLKKFTSKTVISRLRVHRHYFRREILWVNVINQTLFDIPNAIWVSFTSRYAATEAEMWASLKAAWSKQFSI